MIEPTIICPNCKTEIRLTESLAAPLIAATKKQFEQQLSQKDEVIAKREQGIRDKEKLIAEAKRNLDTQVSDQVAAQLKSERACSFSRYHRPTWRLPASPNAWRKWAQHSRASDTATFCQWSSKL